MGSRVGGIAEVAGLDNTVPFSSNIKIKLFIINILKN